MHTKEQLLELHSEHQEWQSKINFYKDELKIFDNELAHLAKVTPTRETLASIEHFQNQFIRQREVLDILRHDFKQYENEIEFIQKNEVDKTAAGIEALHENQKDSLDQFEKIFKELRDDFHNFLKGAKNLN
ncbi:MAG: hypothetical protein ABI723_21515 [Bacteroidia bacterium]